jgi:hypothetical protein
MSIQRQLVIRIVLALVVIAGGATAVSAQGAGVRGGVSVDPDQGFLGAHFETGPLVEHLHFRPNLEVGFGDDVATTAVNLEFVYKWPLPRSPWNFYAGGGPAINLYNFDDDTDAEGGLNLLGGLEHDSGFFFEVKTGLWDSPDLKALVGYTFSVR